MNGAKRKNKVVQLTSDVAQAAEERFLAAFEVVGGAVAAATRRTTTVISQSSTDVVEVLERVSRGEGPAATPGRASRVVEKLPPDTIVEEADEAEPSTASGWLSASASEHSPMPIGSSSDSQKHLVEISQCTRPRVRDTTPESPQDAGPAAPASTRAAPDVPADDKV